MEIYIEDKKNLYILIHKFLEDSDELNKDDAKKDYFPKLSNEGDVDEMRQFLKIIKSIGEYHHRDPNFNERINKILLHYKDQIKGSLSNNEIFHIFENNKKIVHFLLKENIITISDDICTEMMNKVENNGKRYCHFFIPELENFVGKEKIESVKNDLLKEDPTIFIKYEEKRKEGENDSFICSLIRQDSIKEFIAYVNRHNISPTSTIVPSIFETNSFLIENKNPTLIEYSAFFGSIQIFQYFIMNKAELKPSLWLYAIHSKNPDLFHLLETNQVPPPINYEQCLIESIKCHHNDFAEYIENNLIDQSKSLQENDEIVSNCIKYYNYAYFQVDAIVDHGFFYLYFYHYDKLFELLLQKKEKIIEEKMIQYEDFQDAVENNEVEVIYYYLLKIQEIPEELFARTEIKQIAIPSSITSIGESAFFGCSSLIQIAIPSSVTSIGDSAFGECSSLVQITIPSSVTSIGKTAFVNCSSLTQITIHSSVTSIGEFTFSGCSSLTQITIPSSVTEIDEGAFNECSSLEQITIPSSVTVTNEGAFNECSSLTQITIPSSVTSIGDDVFMACSSLTQITFGIPSSVTEIGNSVFSGCSSLIQITIPSSVVSIGTGAFSGCSSLAQITFEVPSSVSSIGKFAFIGCSSLTQITIPSSVTSIGESAFKKCSSLKKMSLPCAIDKTQIGISSEVQITLI